MPTEVSLITLTGDRPWAFSLCEKYMARQTIQDYQWVVVDDGQEPTTVTMGQQYVRLPPAESPQESFRRNLSVAFEMVQGQKVLFWEDDDAVVSRFWIELMKEYLNRYDVVGEGFTKYYHCRHRRFKVHPNGTHASLCQTGVRVGQTTRLMQKYLREHPRPQQMDGALWKRLGIPDSRKYLIPCSTQVIALKGLPGRGGLGIHHTLEELNKNGYRHDPDATVLKQWLAEDAEPYLSLYEPPAVTDAPSLDT